jgi:cobalt-zinc-cadmium efflux system protein
MSPHHHPENPSFNRAFLLGTSLNIGFVVIEAVFSFLTNSVALLADAGHNLSDVLGLLLAWGASCLVRLRPTPRYTYGLRRSSILVAVLNGVILFVALSLIAIEAVQRLSHPLPIAEMTIIAVALVGVLINGITAYLFMSGQSRDLNIKGAFLHMATDTFISLGVVLAGVGMMLTGWLWFDPVISLIIAIVMGIGTWNLLQESVNLALDGVPADIDPQAVRTYLDSLPGVVAVHDLHIWAMSTTEPVLTVHLTMPTGHPGDALLSCISEDLHHKFGIEHTTIQVEIGNFILPCSQKHCCD